MVTESCHSVLWTEAADLSPVTHLQGRQQKVLNGVANDLYGVAPIKIQVGV